MTRAAMWGLLVVVASAAAVLSFAALRDLAVLCGFSTRLAWLLPLVIDAGAAAGCLVWLGRECGTFSTGRLSGTQPKGGGGTTSFGRSLTFVLLATSVLGNAVVHGLTAYHLTAPWWLVVAVSAVAPAVLGAVVHLAVLVGHPKSPRDPGETYCHGEQPQTTHSENKVGADRHQPLTADRQEQTTPKIKAEAMGRWGVSGNSPPSHSPHLGPAPDRDDPVAELLAAGAGRRRLARELDISEHAARQLLATRNGADFGSPVNQNPHRNGAGR